MFLIYVYMYVYIYVCIYIYIYVWGCSLPFLTSLQMLCKLCNFLRQCRCSAYFAMQVYIFLNNFNFFPMPSQLLIATSEGRKIADWVWSWIEDFDSRRNIIPSGLHCLQSCFKPGLQSSFPHTLHSVTE